MNRIVCQFHGHVQGVGFRYTTQNLARGFSIGGYVRNLPNGSVELVMEGPDDQMEGLVQAIQRQLGQFIKRTNRQVEPATGEFTDFVIRH